MFKKLLIAIGAVTLLLGATVLIMLFVYPGMDRAEANRENSRRFAERFFTALANGGPNEELTEAVTADLRDAAAKPLQRFAVNMKSFGKLLDSHCQSYGAKTNLHGTTAHCEIDAKFQNGVVWAKIEMKQESNTWLVNFVEYGGTLGSAGAKQ